jgi:uncharacterized protein (DUF736 family)
MSIIGKFDYVAGEYHGRIETISAEFSAKFVPTSKTAGSNAPDFNLVTDNGCDLGVAWKETKDDRDYLSVRLEGPFTPAEVNCALFSNREGGFDLVWNRAGPKKAQA